MTGVLMVIDPVLVLVLVATWCWAGIHAARLPHGATAGVIRRRATTTVVLIVVGILLALSRIWIVAVLGVSGWRFVQEKVVLSLPLLLAPAMVALGLSVPRLARLRSAAGVFPEVVPPSLRQEAAHPMVAWPVHATAIGAVAGVVVFSFFSYAATAGSSFAVATAAGITALLCWLALRRRYERFAQEVVFPSRRARLARSTSIVVIGAALAIAGPLAALALAAPAPEARTDAGPDPVDLSDGIGGGERPVQGGVPAVGVDTIQGMGTPRVRE